MKPTKDDLKRYTDNYLREQDGIALYRALAKAERDSANSEIFEKLAKAEERHLNRNRFGVTLLKVLSEVRHHAEGPNL